ncbi:hypothetical protein AU255_13720 [Methyloprofundus sedimenti]|uniref:DUF1772 domain-containing protein n=1 Tax=Methyloprofundus sedimenti TaxID=1420851 RepID=A0A1V8M3L6_9GAMM|nr:hypothetical protein AU255_13720 [Methyloprofundus sedimenti]
MTALGNIAPAEGIKAMQRINIDLFCWSFSFLFFGIPLASLGLGVYAVWQWSEPDSVFYLMGGIVYLAGCFGVTAAANVPLNNALAQIDPDADSATNEWRMYLVRSTHWNHVRTVACLIACILIISASYAN